MTKLVVDKKCPGVGALLAAKAAEAKVKISITWSDESSYSMDGGIIGATSTVGIARSVIIIIFFLGGGGGTFFK